MDYADLFPIQFMRLTCTNNYFEECFRKYLQFGRGGKESYVKYFVSLFEKI